MFTDSMLGMLHEQKDVDNYENGMYIATLRNAAFVSTIDPHTEDRNGTLVLFLCIKMEDFLIAIIT